MDYSGRNNFNSLWIIIIAFGAFWLAFSGIILIFKSFSLTEFKAAWMKITRAGNSRTLTVLDIYGGLDNKITAAFGTSVYDSLALGGITLPSNCGGGGSCGLCRVKFKGQGQPVLEADRRQLCQQELDDGYRLSCQHRLTRDSLVELPQDLLSCDAFEARVIAVRSLTPTIKEITLTLSSGDIFCYQAGSYLLVEIPDDQGHKLTRAYSLATPSQERPTEIVFNIRQLMVPANQPDIPAGIGSGYMCNLTVGDRVNLSGPFGHFAARASDNEMIFIGGGAGMAPLRAIIRDQLLHKKTQRKISFWYGVRNSEDIFYQEEFKTLAQQHDNMEFRIGLSEPKAADNWDGPTGFIHKITMEHYLADHPDLSKVEFYLCGPPAMLAATRAMLHDLGIAGEKIVFDDFGI
ncbi:MAG: 2Fe-2S iron-sulfur cluster binding domain-containing protein [Alphaproteobacteria bacterium]|nr:2Fe-2S iron-sulfur cluster binding domain-containing protein [Alphaproteobacteria bacterium]